MNYFVNNVNKKIKIECLYKIIIILLKNFKLSFLQIPFIKIVNTYEITVDKLKKNKNLMFKRDNQRRRQR